MSLVLLGCTEDAPSEEQHSPREGVGEKPETPPSPDSSEEKASAPDEPSATPSPPFIDPELRSRPVPEQQAYLFDLLLRNGTSLDRVQNIKTILSANPMASFGNPDVSKPALSQQECWAKKGEHHAADPACPAPNMVRVAPDADVCIDQYEFPNLRCEYPLVWARASEAARICDTLGKRLCDAHEWEAACAGQLHEPATEYNYEKLPKGFGAEYRRSRRLLAEDWHNSSREIVWAYGSRKDPTICGTMSSKSPKCQTTTYQHCGTNNYPAGSFPQCVSKQGVYDQHGNAAEHMSLPLFPEELGGAGWTEMKGSWFIAAETHPDDCRWRAKNWHTTRISDPNSHNNYHLGFRCCASVREK